MEQFSSAPHQNEENAIRYLTNFGTLPALLSLPSTNGILVKSSADDEEGIKKKEESIMELGNILAKRKNTHELRKMIENTRPFLASLGKAKAAKLVRNLVDLCLCIEDQDGDIKVGLSEKATDGYRNLHRSTCAKSASSGRRSRIAPSSDRLFRLVLFACSTTCTATARPFSKASCRSICESIFLPRCFFSQQSRA